MNGKILGLKLLKLIESKKHNKTFHKDMMKYVSEKGGMAFQIHTTVNELMGVPLQNMEAVINVLGSLNAMPAEQIQDMYDKLTQRIVDLEDAVETAKKSHMFGSI